MKETNSLETQLRSWKLRPPSARLEQRIFRPSASLPTLAMALRWLAPASVSALVVLGLLSQQSGIRPGSSPREPMVGMILSNQSPVASLSNDLPRTGSGSFSGTFEWTNRTGSTSSMGSFSSGRVN